MKLGLQISGYRWPGGPVQIGPRLGEIARVAEDVGYTAIWAMDHFLQVPQRGPADDEMLEAYSVLNFIAGHTRQVGLGVMVTAVTYRHPAVLIKQVTTLDVVSGGRASLGIGAGWYQREHAAMGIPFPPLAERLERLEETLQIAHQTWHGDTTPYAGRHYQLAETHNSPPAISLPHPPILVGGGGEKKTLRLVARYADACNLFGDLPSEQLVRKLAVLREHCQREGRDYAEIEKTVLLDVDVGEGGTGAQAIVDEFGALAEIGFQTAIATVKGVETLRPLEIIGRDVIPQVTPF